MKAMLLGGNGFIGSAVVRSLVAQGNSVIMVSRSDTGRTLPGVISEQADRSDVATIRALAERHRADVVIDMIAMTEDSTRSLLQALAERTGRYVLVSSCDVYRNYGGIHRRESAPPLQGPADEDSPLRTVFYPYRSEPRRAGNAPDAWMDDYDKIPIERALTSQDGLEWAVARLPMVFGPGDRQRRFAWAIRPMAVGKPVLEIDAQWARWRSPYSYVDDVAAAVALVATRAAARNRIYNVGRADTPDNAEWARHIAEAMHWQGEMRLVQKRLAPSPLDALDLSYDLRVDTRRIRRELGFEEPTDEINALKATIDDELRREA